MAEARTLIVEDDARLRRCIRDLLATTAGVEVVGEAASGPEALDMTRELHPDLILMDVRLPGNNGIEAMAQIKREMPQVQVIMLTTYDLPEYRDAAIDSGASGYVVKCMLFEALLPTIERVRTGQYVDVAETN